MASKATLFFVMVFMTNEVPPVHPLIVNSMRYFWKTFVGLLDTKDAILSAQGKLLARLDRAKPTIPNVEVIDRVHVAPSFTSIHWLTFPLVRDRLTAILGPVNHL